MKLVVNFLFYFRTDEEEVSLVNIFTCHVILYLHKMFKHILFYFLISFDSQLEPCCWSNVGWKKKIVRASLSVSWSIMFSLFYYNYKISHQFTTMLSVRILVIALCDYKVFCVSA